LLLGSSCYPNIPYSILSTNSLALTLASPNLSF